MQVVKKDRNLQIELYNLYFSQSQDTVYIVDAIIEKSPHFRQDGIHTHHLIIGGKGQPTVWVSCIS